MFKTTITFNHKNSFYLRPIDKKKFWNVPRGAIPSGLWPKKTQNATSSAIILFLIHVPIKKSTVKGELLVAHLFWQVT